MTEAVAVLRDQSEGYINISLKKDFEPLEFTGRIGGGLVQDLRRRLPFYVSDWTDAFRMENANKSVTTIVYLFAAALAPAITFGSQFRDGTGGQFGVAEMILSTAISGVICAMFAGQPLALVGPTGPFLAYTLVCYDLSLAVDLEFLPYYFWVCMWCGLFTILVAIFDLCALMKHITMFTEDIFVGLVSFVFIVDGAKPIILNFVEERVSLGAAMFESLLFMYTFGLATYLSHFRRTHWLNRPIRNFLANSAVTIALVSASLLAAIYANLDIRMLPMDDDFAPSLTVEGGGKRSWIVNPAGIDRPFPAWGVAYAIFPALGFTVLGYLDENLTTLILNRPSNNLKKPPGYHLDIFVRGLLLMPACGILGLPMSVASTVPSITHLISLTTYEERHLSVGDRKVPTKVVEQRATNFIIHGLLGFALFMAPVLTLLPKAVLQGVFFYMGISSLTGNNMFDRMCLWLVWDTSKYPPRFHFLHELPTTRVHLYTLFQVICLGILYALKTISEVAVVFPLFIATLAVIRKALGSIFSEAELQLLDQEPVGEDEASGAFPGIFLASRSKPLFVAALLRASVGPPADPARRPVTQSSSDPEFLRPREVFVAGKQPDLLDLGLSREEEEEAQAKKLEQEFGADDFLPRSLSCE
ncbi:Slc4a1 [Symbiodinium natans]|uniref:Slc4a1 protein n=1 Tax=Symbiodinium natans TaxID=878477 RepID=A0A812UVM0_9DINO|nr:Slc4a1 [Symbiodinium natans]